MVDAVVRRRVHHCFEPARAAIDRFSVYPELVDQVEAAAERQHQRMKTNQQQWQAEHERSGKETRPRLAQCGRQIIMLARVMIDMARPEPADTMRAAMKRVIGQIVENKA